MMTTDNERFLRQWFEVSINSIRFDFKDRESAEKSSNKWFPYNKGGGYRKWYGLQTLIVNWQFGGREIIQNGMTSFRGKNYYFKEGITWSDVATGDFTCRHTESGSIFDIKGTSAFPDKNLIGLIACTLNSKGGSYILHLLNPTMSYQSGDIRRVPITKELYEQRDFFNENYKKLTEISKKDWDRQEISWNYSKNPLITKQGGVEDNLKSLLMEFESDKESTIQLESENNSIIINEYGLNNEISPTPNINEITLISNTCYYYKGLNNSDEHYKRQRSDIISDLLSYIIGCQMGRYSLDREGLVYAHEANKGFAALVGEGAYQTFPADEDGILPLMDTDWFDDDVTARIKEFVRTVWGEEHLQENLDFIAESLCLYAIKPKKGESSLDTIRRYLSTQFWKDHMKMYKKRPIYWLFSSGKEKAFECLVYLHRYNDATLSRMRTEYVVPLLARYQGNIDLVNDQLKNAESGAATTRLKKELDGLSKKFNELRNFDDRLRHYADRRITIDLDDGVKVNYGKFGDLLADVKAITGSAPLEHNGSTSPDY